MADRQSRRKVDPQWGVGNFIRQWCWEHGMILRNNGDILVTAPRWSSATRRSTSWSKRSTMRWHEATNKFPKP